MVCGKSSHEIFCASCESRDEKSEIFPLCKNRHGSSYKELSRSWNKGIIEYGKAEGGIRTALTTTSATAAGYLASEELDRLIIGRLPRYGVTRSNMRVKKMNQYTLKINKRTGGLSAYIVAQGSSTTESNITFDQISASAVEVAVLCVTSNLLNPAFPM